MDIRKLFSTAFLITSMVSLSACGGGGGSDEPDTGGQEVDNPPVIANYDLDTDQGGIYDLSVSATVTDDHAVSSVDLYINGKNEATLTDEDGDSVYTVSWEFPGNGEYQVYIKATDSSNQETLSQFSVITIGSGVVDAPPVISNFTFNPDSLVQEGNSVEVSLTATDDESISKVELFAVKDFFADASIEDIITSANLIGEMTPNGSLYSISWTPTAGNYQLVARATDSADQEDITAVYDYQVVSQQVDLPPQITNFIVNPQPSSKIGDLVIISAKVTDDQSVDSVALYINGTKEVNLSDDNGDNVYTYLWNPPAVNTYSLQIKAEDNNQQIAESSIIDIEITNEVDDLPSISNLQISPAGSVTVGDSITVSVEASDDKGVAKVELLVNNQVVGNFYGIGSTSYRMTSWAPAAGTYSVAARVTDSSSQTTTTQPVSYQVVEEQQDAKPVISGLQVSPAGSATVGDSITVAVEASDDKGVTKVELLIDGQVAGNFYGIGNTSYRMTSWVPAVGTYSVAARVTDSASQTSVTQPISYQIIEEQQDEDPVVSNLQISPAGSSVEGDAITVTVTASDDKGLTKVELLVNGQVAGNFTGIGGDQYRITSWAPAVGTYSVSAKATDSAGQTAIAAPLSYQVTEQQTDDDEAPQISNFNLNKTANITEGDVITATVTVTDNVEVASVELYVDGSQFAAMSANGSQYIYSWDTDGYFGSYDLQVRAKDTSNNLKGSSIITITIEENNWVAPEGTGIIKRVTNFGDNPGHHEMYYYVPEDLEPNSPVVMALHGCNQDYEGTLRTGGVYDISQSSAGLKDAMQFAYDSEWHVLADEYKFIVIYPQQPDENTSGRYGNPYRCFNWSGYYGANVYRGEGGNKSLIEMINYVKANYDVNNDKVYVTGLSAGGAMATLMAATYPDVFAGASSMAGIAYHCALNGGNAADNSFACMGVNDDATFSSRCMGSQTACMDDSLKKTPKQWGDLVRTKGYPGYTGDYPKMIIWQGDTDQYVDPDQMIETAEQWVNVHDSSVTDINSVAVSGSVLKDGANHNYTEYVIDGEVKVATVELPGMSHGITVDPTNTDEDGGGKGKNHGGAFNASWSMDRGIYSSYYTAKFWGLIDDAGKPQVEITYPAENNQILAESTPYKITADASFDQGIDSVEFYVNGQLECTDSSSPYECDTTTAGYTRGDELAIKVLAYNSSAAKPGKDELTAWVGEKGFKCVDYKDSMYDHRMATPPRTEKVSGSYGTTYSYKVIGSEEIVDGLSSSDALNKDYDIREIADGYFELGTCADR